MRNKYNLIISISIISILLQDVCPALAPTTSLAKKETAGNKYQLILERLNYTGIPKDRFEEFIREAEILFEGYRSFSRFPFNPQAAVQFAENKKSLVREIQRLFIESLGHIRKRAAVSRRQGMMRLEELVKARLGGSDYAVVDLMGRPGVGKSTVAGKIKKGFASLKPNEILVIPVDGFRNNDVVLVNQLIENRAFLNMPLRELPDEKYGFFEKVSRSLQFPLIRDSDRSFLDFYLVAEDRELETGESKRTFRRRRLWNYIGSNPRLQRVIDIPLRSMSQEDYSEIIRIAKEMRLNTDRFARNSQKSFSEIYEETDREEFLEDVRKKERAEWVVRLFIVEGTYSYQGEKIFEPSAERLMEKSPGNLIRVMIELDEGIRHQRIRDRHRSDTEEMLILQPIFDAIFLGSVDLERESSDIIIDNTESTDLFQTEETHSGVKAQFGIISETARAALALEIFEKEPPPDIYVLPPELFKGGRSYADFEFLLYYKFFIKGGKKVSIVGTTEQKGRIMEFLKQSLYGPDLDRIEGISPGLRQFLRDTRDHFAVRNKTTGEILPLEAYIDFHVVDIGSEAVINVVKDNRTIPLRIAHIRAGVFSLEEEGYEPRIVEVDYREPSEENYSLTAEQQIALQNARSNVMAVTPMGSEDGFTPMGDYTNFIVWLEGVGIHVDPSPRSLIYLKKAGIDPDDIPYILLTHNHADHDSGLIQKILMKKRVKLLASRPVYEGFVIKARMLIGEGFTVEDWIDWIELSDERTNEVELPNGNKAQIDIRYNMHSIPTAGFIVSYKGKRFGYSGDTLYDPGLINDWFSAGKLTREQRDKLLYFFWDEEGNPKVDLLFHEAGVPPIHTQIDVICQFPEKVYESMYLVHLSPARLRDPKEVKEPVTDEKLRRFINLRQPELFDTKILIPADKDAEREILAKTLENVTLLSHLDPGEKMELLRHGIVKTYNPGEPVIFEGYRGDTFYIILSGHAEVVAGGEKVVDASSKEWLLGGRPVWTYYPKDSFGEVALVDDRPRTASVRAVSSLKVLEIHRGDFLNLIYAPLRREDSEILRRIKYCIEEWIQRYSENLIYNISDFNLTQIARQVRISRYPKGEKIIRQGDVADKAYIILDGKVGVYRAGSLVATRTYGDIIGEMALLEMIMKKGVVSQRNADCIAENDVEVLELSSELFSQILHTYPGLDRGLRYEYRKRLLPQGMQYKAPHEYIVRRPERKPEITPRVEREGIIGRGRFELMDLEKLTEPEKIILFLNDIFSDLEFFAPDEFSNEFYNPALYRENLIRLIQYLKEIFPSFQVQRFYHKFIEVSIYDDERDTKTVYRFSRGRKKNVYRWQKESEVEIITDIPNMPVNSLLVNLESERYEGVKGTPENVKTLQAYLEMYNPECNLGLIDCQWPENSLDFIIQRIKAERPEMVCISSTFGCIKELERLLRAVRKMPFKPLVVVGGLTATWSYEYLLERYPEIICVQREGEEALSSLVKIVYENGVVNGRLEDNRLLETVPNLIYRENGRIVKNPVKRVDLSKTPHPSRRSQLSRLKNAGFLLNSEGASRGCGYGRCSFCTRTHGRLRPLPITRVTGDFEEYMYGGASFIVYADEDFLPSDPNGLDEFISRVELLKEKYRNDYFLENGTEPKDVSFYVASRAECIWREGDTRGNEERRRMLERLKGIGLVKIFLGVESGSTVQLKKTYNKEASLLEMKEAIRVIRSLGIQVVAGFITFDPVVTLGQLQDNIRFVRELGLIEADPLTEPINPFKQYRAQIGSALVQKYCGIGLISSDHNPDTLMHDVVYRSKPVNLIMNIGERWDEEISLLEYSLKGIVWHAEQSPEETERARLFIDLFNWLRERGYILLEELCDELTKQVPDRDRRLDIFFDSLSGLQVEKILFELKRAIFPHTDIYRLIEDYIRTKGFNGDEIISFLKGLFKGEIPADWTFEGGQTREVFSGWINDIARDLSLQVMSDKEIDSIKKRLNEVFRRALIERQNRLEIFRDTDWRLYYSTGPDSIGRGVEFGHLLEDTINRHSDILKGFKDSKGLVSYEESPDFHVYHRTGLHEYFQYRHPDMAAPLAVLYRLVCLFESQGKSAGLNKVFLYPDGTLRCDDMHDASEEEIISTIYQALKQIYISSYNPFNKTSGFNPLSFESALYARAVNISFLKDILRTLYKEYALYSRIDIKEGGSIYFTDRVIDAESNIPASIRWDVPRGVYTLDEEGKPIITVRFSEYINSVVRQLLREGLGESEYRNNIMIVNALVGILNGYRVDGSLDWLTPICDIIDETILPNTVYLPDNEEGRRLACANAAVPVIFVSRDIYERLWPGIGPHLEDIMLIATPGILDDFPKMLEMIKEGRLRTEIVQLIYEVFHNRVNPDAYRRNENFSEIIKYTTNSMRVMPRRTPVLLIDPDNPMVSRYTLDKPPHPSLSPLGRGLGLTQNGRIRFLVHPYAYKKWREGGISFPRPDTEMEWVLTYPTASHRTLFILGRDRDERLIGKVHSTIWAGPAMRRLKPDSVEHSFLVSERIKKPIDRDELPDSIKDRFGYFTEEGFGFKDRALYSEGIGVLYRGLHPYPLAGEDRFLMPTFSAHNNAINVPDNTADNPLTQLIDWNTRDTGEDPVDYFVREILRPLYDIYFYYMFEQGFLLEPHGQNFFLEIDKDGKIKRLIFKDWQSTMVDMALRERLGLSRGRSIVKHLLGIEASESTSMSIVFDYYWGTYLMRQLLEVLVNRYHGDKEKIFYRELVLKRFKDVFTEFYNAYPASHPDFPDISLRHGKKPPGDRTNRVYFAASGAPLLRPTGYERTIKGLIKDPSARKGRIDVPVIKIDDENTVIQRQGDLPDELVIDFDRTRIEEDSIVIYPERYDPARKYDLLILLHGKGSHPARLMDIPEKTGIKDAIIIIPKAPFSFGTGYTWFVEGDKENEMKSKSADFIKGIIGRFKENGRVNNNINILGISEGGYMAHMFGMRFPELTRGIISLNVPFREGYFADADLSNVRPQGYPDIFILQYANDKIVVPANSQRAVDFYRNKGLEPKVRYYSSGSHHRVSLEMGLDINKWVREKQGKPVIAMDEDLDGIGILFKEAETIVEMVERTIPLLLVLLSEDDSVESQGIRERFNLISSSLCYCLFQVRMRLKDSSTKTDPSLLDTVKWIGKETKSLLEELIEIRKGNGPGWDIDLEIDNITKNTGLISEMLGEGKREVLIRVPVQALDGIDRDNAARLLGALASPAAAGTPEDYGKNSGVQQLAVAFLGALQKVANCYVELYSIEGGVEIDEFYTRYGLEKKRLPSGFIKTRENTLTLFVPPAEGELTPGNLLGRLGEIGLGPAQTILSPIGLGYNPVCLVNSTIMGLRLMYIARHRQEAEFINETLEQYKRLFDAEEIELTASDLIDIACGDINDLFKALKRLIRLLPIKRYEASEIERVYRLAEETILAAA